MSRLRQKCYQQSAEEISTEELLCRYYDEILEATAELEFDLVMRKLELLQRGLSFQNEPMQAITLGRLYHYLQECCERREASEIVRIVAQLKDFIRNVE